ENLQIELQRPVIDVVKIEFHPLFKVADLISAVDLPETGQARLHGKAAALPSLILFNLLRKRGPGADDAHVAEEDIIELWKFIEAGPSEETADWGGPGIVGDLEHRSSHFIEVFHLLFH